MLYDEYYMNASSRPISIGLCFTLYSITFMKNDMQISTSSLNTICALFLFVCFFFLNLLQVNHTSFIHYTVALIVFYVAIMVYGMAVGCTRTDYHHNYYKY